MLWINDGCASALIWQLLARLTVLRHSFLPWFSTKCPWRPNQNRSAFPTLPIPASPPWLHALHRLWPPGHTQTCCMPSCPPTPSGALALAPCHPRRLWCPPSDGFTPPIMLWGSDVLAVFLVSPPSLHPNLLPYRAQHPHPPAFLQLDVGLAWSLDRYSPLQILPLYHGRCHCPGCPYRLPDSSRGLHQFLGSHRPQLPVTTRKQPALTAPFTQTAGLCELPLSGTETLPARVSTRPPRNGYLLPQDTCYHATASKALVSSIISQKMHWVQFYTLGYRGPPRQTSSRCSLGSGGGGVKNQHTQILFMEQEWNTSADPWRRSSDWLEKQLLR